MYIETEKACVLAEELGHHYTTVGDIIDQKESENRKQERRARIWAYHEMISLSDLVDCYHSRYQNEYEVAEHFHIPLRQIKEWIREGRIEYHEVDTASTISGMHCQRCGAPVSFGTLCPNCLKLMNTQGRSVAPAISPDSRMHYLDTPSDKTK